jgi:hypothetical protein
MTNRSPPERRAAPRETARPRYPLAPTRTRRLTLETVASRSGLHPDLVRRFVALSLLQPSRDASGRLWFAPDTPTTIARIQRLRAGLCLNYAAIGLVLDLLDRIEALEAALRSSVATAQYPEGWIRMSRDPASAAPGPAGSGVPAGSAEPISEVREPISEVRETPLEDPERPDDRLATRHGTHNEEGLGAGRHRGGQRGVR